MELTIRDLDEEHLDQNLADLFELFETKPDFGEYSDIDKQ